MAKKKKKVTKKQASSATNADQLAPPPIVDIPGTVGVFYDAGQGSMRLSRNPIRPVYVRKNGKIDRSRARITFVLVAKDTNPDFQLRFGNIVLCDYKDEEKLTNKKGQFRPKRSKHNQNQQDSWTYTFQLNKSIKPNSPDFLVEFDCFCIYYLDDKKSRRQHTTLRQIAGLDPSMLLPPGG